MACGHECTKAPGEQAAPCLAVLYRLGFLRAPHHGLKGKAPWAQTHSKNTSHGCRDDNYISYLQWWQPESHSMARMGKDLQRCPAPPRSHQRGGTRLFTVVHSRTTRTNRQRLNKTFRLDVRRNLFPVKTAVQWQGLPREAVQCLWRFSRSNCTRPWVPWSDPIANPAWCPFTPELSSGPRINIFSTQVSSHKGWRMTMGKADGPRPLQWHRSKRSRLHCPEAFCVHISPAPCL